MIQKLSLLGAALLLSLAAVVSGKPEPARAATPSILLCPDCPPGWVSSGPPFCRCTRGND
jgi:hypothetical protein